MADEQGKVRIIQEGGPTSYPLTKRLRFELHGNLSFLHAVARQDVQYPKYWLRTKQGEVVT